MRNEREQSYSLPVLRGEGHRTMSNLNLHTDEPIKLSDLYGIWKEDDAVSATKHEPLWVSVNDANARRGITRILFHADMMEDVVFRIGDKEYTIDFPAIVRDYGKLVDVSNGRENV